MHQARKSAFEPPYIAIIDRLIARRQDLNITQSDLGARFGEDQSFISRVERRQRRIDMWEFVRLCRLLDIDSSTVLREVEVKYSD